MSSLTWKDKEYLERLFNMGDGLVLDFSNRTFAEFFQGALHVDIYADDYNHASGSKANRLRGLWDAAPDDLVARSIHELLDYIQLRIDLGTFAVHDYPEALTRLYQALSVTLSE